LYLDGTDTVETDGWGWNANRDKYMKLHSICKVLLEWMSSPNFAWLIFWLCPVM